MPQTEAPVFFHFPELEKMTVPDLQLAYYKVKEALTFEFQKCRPSRQPWTVTIFNYLDEGTLIEWADLHLNDQGHWYTENPKDGFEEVGSSKLEDVLKYLDSKVPQADEIREAGSERYTEQQLLGVLVFSMNETNKEWHT